MSMRREAAFGGWNREHAECLPESCRGSDSGHSLAGFRVAGGLPISC
jgi:hypothetical protein